MQYPAVVSQVHGVRRESGATAQALAVTVSAQVSRILVVDDDKSIRSLVSDFLRAQGEEVLTAADGVEMHSVLAQHGVDLIVLDLMLPGRSGLDLCRELRGASQTPIIMLTARGDEVDRVVGLEVGADDYIAKPFSPRELLARIKAVLRRSQATSVGDHLHVFHFSGWRLDTLRRELFDPKGVAVDLSTGEYDLLATFLEASQRVLSRDYLMEQARGRSYDVFDRVIDVQISRLRRKLGAEEEMIKTVRGVGYLFAPSVRRAAQ